MKIAVTGASGNLGSALLRRIQEVSGTPADHQVLGVSRRAPSWSSGGWLTADVSDDSQVDTLAEDLRGCDALAHLAWKIQPGRNEDELWRTNVAGTSNVLRAAAGAGIKHVVVASSVGAYAAGPKTGAVDESWPTTGVPTSSYGRHKAEVERLLDAFEAGHPDITVSRIRPGLVFQDDAASEIVRIFLGPLVPTRLIGRIHLPAVPIPAELIFQAVHADDVAAAFWTVISQQAGGAFNVAADPPLTPDDVARAIGARRSVPMPLGVLRFAADVAWRAHLQPTEPGWIDLAAQVPVMSTARLRALGWAPSRSSHEALAELIAGIQQGHGVDSYPPLLPRSQKRAAKV